VEVTLWQWTGLASACFGAGLLDAVAGGGGLLSLPALKWAGLPSALALGTNKLVAVNGSLVSTLRYARAGLVRRDAAGLAILSCSGGALGASTALRLPERILHPALIILLIASLAAVLWLQAHPPRPRPAAAALPAWVWAGALALGFYDGFFGPGTGTFLIAMLAAAGLGLEQASGSAKPLNFGSNLGALAVFAWRGSVLPWLGLSLIPFMVLGSWAGASLAVRRGAPVIRLFLVLAVLAICAKLAWGLV